jgi:indolepyruvate ferredoxin oxidoreductase
MTFGGWMWSLLRLLAPLKSLRGSALDVFGYALERRKERG